MGFKDAMPDSVLKAAGYGRVPSSSAADLADAENEKYDINRNSSSDADRSEESSCSNDEERLLSDDGSSSNKILELRRQEVVIRFKRSFLLYISLAFLVLVVVASIAIASQPEKGEKDPREGGNFPTYPMPDFPMEPVQFQAQAAFAMGSMPESDSMWDSMIPRHNGVVEIENWADYGLDPGYPTDRNNSMVYQLTWTHSMHCLKMIRMEFWSLINGQSDLLGSDPRGDNLDWRAQFVIRHINHCFDYHRQQILCNADMTFEAEAPREFETDPHHITGMGTWHMCKKREPVLDWMDSLIPRDPRLLLPEFHRPPSSFQHFVEEGQH